MRGISLKAQFLAACFTTATLKLSTKCNGRTCIKLSTCDLPIKTNSKTTKLNEKMQAATFFVGPLMLSRDFFGHKKL